LRYLTHKNAPNKYQYGEDLVKSNFDWKAEAEKKNKREREIKLLELIMDGTIREYNFHEFIAGQFYINNKRKIESAFNYRRQSIRNMGERNMKCIYITGKPGVGKTTYAKQLVLSKGYSYFISSSSNDPLDGYQGQDCIILDDLRGSSMSLADLLKLLDNHTASTVKSRYYNKVLECKLIIITTTQDIDRFFSNVFKDDNESATQLKRRCTAHIDMTEKEIIAKGWDNALQRYSDYSLILPNTIYKMFVGKEKTAQEMMQVLMEDLNLSMENTQAYMKIKQVQETFINEKEDNKTPF